MPPFTTTADEIAEDIKILDEDRSYQGSCGPNPPRAVVVKGDTTPVRVGSAWIIGSLGAQP